jgi:hypothetical protein
VTVPVLAPVATRPSAPPPAASNDEEERASLRADRAASPSEPAADRAAGGVGKS